jgi:hypothetical protein
VSMNRDHLESLAFTKIKRVSDLVKIPTLVPIPDRTNNPRYGWESTSTITSGILAM